MAKHSEKVQLSLRGLHQETFACMFAWDCAHPAAHSLLPTVDPVEHVKEHMDVFRQPV